MSAGDKSWITASRISREYVLGINSFLNFAFKTETQKQIRCPCKKCWNRYWMDRDTVRTHCIIYGFNIYYTNWDLHGEPLIPLKQIRDGAEEDRKDKVKNNKLKDVLGSENATGSEKGSFGQLEHTKTKADGQRVDTVSQEIREKTDAKQSSCGSSSSDPAESSCGSSSSHPTDVVPKQHHNRRTKRGSDVAVLRASKRRPAGLTDEEVQQEVKEDVQQ